MRLQLNTHLLHELLQRLLHMNNLIHKLCINSEELLKIIPKSFELWKFLVPKVCACLLMDMDSGPFSDRIQFSGLMHNKKGDSKSKQKTWWHLRPSLVVF